MSSLIGAAGRPQLASVAGVTGRDSVRLGAQTVEPSLLPHAVARHALVDSKSLAERAPVEVVPRPTRPMLQRSPEMQRLIADLARALGHDKELAPRLTGALRGATLDLRGLSAKAIERLRPEVWTALAEMAKQPVESVMFPEGMSVWPTGLERFSGIVLIAVPAFKGACLVLPAQLADAVVFERRADHRVPVQSGALSQQPGVLPYSTERSRLSAGALQLFRDAMGGPTLKLDQLSHQALACLPAAAWDMLKFAAPPTVSAVTLPAGLTTLPAGIERLDALTTLTLPDFKGTRIALPDALRKVRLHTPGTAQTVKISVLRADGKGNVVSEKLDGHVYFRQSPAGVNHERMVRQNLNSAAQFKSGEQILCRHLAMAQILSRIEHLEAAERGPGVARFGYDDFSSARNITGRVAHLDDRVWHDIMLGKDCENHLFPVSEMTQILRGISAEMERDRVPVAHFLMTSSNHAMSLELRIKQDASGASRYALTLFDPNRTMTHRRAVTSDPAGLQLGMEDLIGRECTQAYFGSREHGFVRLTGITKAHLLGGPRPPAAPWKFHTLPQQSLGAQEVHMLVLMNAPGRLRERLAHLPTDREARRTALAGRPDDVGAAFVATTVASLEVYLSAVLNDPVLTREDKFGLLATTAKGQSLVAKALQLPSDQWVEESVTAILESDLTQDQKVALLLAPDQGKSAIEQLSFDREQLLVDLLSQASVAQLSDHSREVLGARMGLVIPPASAPDLDFDSATAATPRAPGAG